MTRKTSRRFANYSKQNEDQRFNEQLPLQGKSSQQQQQLTGYSYMEKDNDSTIADMAQGFLQAQAKISDQSSAVNNLEIALLLQKCNNQLEELRRSTQGNEKGNSIGDQSSSQTPMKNMGEQKQDGKQGNKQQQQSGIATQDLSGLLTTSLQGKDNNQNTTQESSTIQNKNNSNANSGDQQNMMAVQNVSQVLAQAQYELANELENSLKKLKQVIAESEKIANNISNLLGAEGTTKS